MFSFLHACDPAYLHKAIALSLFLRVLLATQGHSGMGIAPMFGDYEAQRHWLEITLNLPASDWYHHTSLNDLQYWGLDYPPLTAYVSLFFAYVARNVFGLEGLVSLTDSRGYEGWDGKVFMRCTVLVCDIVILLPVLLLIVDRVWDVHHTMRPPNPNPINNISKRLPKSNINSDKANTTTNTNTGDSGNSDSSDSSYRDFYECGMLLFYSACTLSPCLVLIDHGHFQYNNVCIGLALWGALCILDNRDILGSIFFCLSLNFKQMALYYAPVFFFVLLKKCLNQRSTIGFFVKIIPIGLAVICTFAVMWAPFCLQAGPGLDGLDLLDVTNTSTSTRRPDETCLSAMQQVAHRLFPFARGLFEDKVSNIWYALRIDSLVYV